jgi:hypothetical protein
MSKQPKGVKGMRRKLHAQQEISRFEIKRAMKEASEALDRQTQEIAALKRIIIGERAQVIYYTEKYRGHVAREVLELVAVGFLDLGEEQQEKYVKLAIKEMETGYGLIAHDSEAAKVQEESATLGKKIIQ